MEEKKEETIETKISTDAAPASDADNSAEPSPIKEEIKRVIGSKTELEKALYTKQQLEKRIKDLQGDVAEVATPGEVTDDAPMTVAMYKKLEQEKAAKTSLDLAGEIQDEDERTLTKHYLTTRIRPSGNPQEDLRFARAAVNSLKNSQIAEEAARKTAPRTTSSGAGNPAKPPEGIFEPTAEEASMMRPPFNLSEADIKKAREQSQK
jgi:hypothetical protein